jgi:hypothetical protein
MLIQEPSQDGVDQDLLVRIMLVDGFLGAA